MSKPTVHDIAREAGVSLATVDRVLNSRPGVREKTVKRVKDAVQKLGYTRDIYAANLARQRRYEFVFVLPRGPSQFLVALRDAILETAAGPLSDRANIRILSAPYSDPVAVDKVFRQIEQEQVDGVAIMGNETPMVRDGIARLKARNVVVVALVTDQTNSARDHFVGIDNTAAGRTAGVLMGRFVGDRAGKVAVVVNTMQARDMVQRRMGFDDVMAERFPHIQVLPSVEGRDDHELTARVTEQCLRLNEDVVGLYCVGAGLRGVTQVLRGRGQAHDLVVVGHDLTPHARDALEAGVVDVIINQNAGHIARSAMRVLRAHCDGVEVIASQEKIRIEIVLRENLT
ncbi:LacI family DNA-binding transcriptional regulator [Thalassococcus sp. S3]|uniref:LacI family DNA-binding transcriptional regulator n=1 Tax=Thalassococcus sp. S3 TaxID=2017482 RepID=UPI0010243E9D|nr:LacI family DNA-binding transcriptional regulator [Thalassococcus sp. S3]QBF30555.1 LacI family transcriptional regulator [Thalassococcus sp. S3]